MSAYRDEYIPSTEAVLVDSARQGRDRNEQAALGFLARYRVKHTRYHYGLALKQWFAFCDEHFVEPLSATRAHIEIFARELELTGRKLATVASKLNALAGFYRYAQADGLIDRDPMVHVRRPVIDRESTTLGLTRPELSDMLTAAEESVPRDYALICILGLNGLRIGETLNIRIEDFGTYKGQVTVDIVRKGGKRQAIPFCYRTAWAVETYRAGREGGFLFLSTSGNQMDRSTAGRVVKRMALAAGVTRRITPHSLRHTFVTLSRDAGISDRDIISSTGHADGRMIEYYDRHRNNIERNATHGLAAFVDRAG